MLRFKDFSLVENKETPHYRKNRTHPSRGIGNFFIHYPQHRGENKLDSQLLLLDYFLPYGLYAGGGFGTAKLDTSIGSASKTAPALHFGYQHNFTNNFSLEAGLLWFGASFSLEKSAAAPEATISDIAIPAIPSPIISSALVGASLGTPPLNNISFIAFVYNIGTFSSNSFSDKDRRILVTGEVTPTYSYTNCKANPKRQQNSQKQHTR